MREGGTDCTSLVAKGVVAARCSVILRLGRTNAGALRVELRAPVREKSILKDLGLRERCLEFAQAGLEAAWHERAQFND